MSANQRIIFNIVSGGLVFILFIIFNNSIINYSQAATTQEKTTAIQQQISTHNEAIVSLQQDIQKYQQKIGSLRIQKNTLANTIQTLSLQEKEINVRLTITSTKIASTNLTLQKLEFTTTQTQQKINSQYTAVASSLRTIQQTYSVSPIIYFLSGSDFSDAWVIVDYLDQFTKALNIHAKDLTDRKNKLQQTYIQVQKEKTSLSALKREQLSQQHTTLAIKKARTNLLLRTKYKESVYQNLIVQKKEAEKSMEKELIRLQAQLHLIVHPGSFPKPQPGILEWPFSHTIMRQCATNSKYFGNTDCITQYFGNTPFATKNPQVYSGHGHDGIDIGVIIGTSVRAALSGIVLDIGNTDLVHNSSGQQCYSFGKWIMIAHANGLNTMYAHLSEIDVHKGQAVVTGEHIGYSGMTGYATGPHLHFGVYAAEGTKIMTLGSFHDESKTRCANAIMPVATLNAYLNPLSYLPKN